jgi:hypothetical protein
MPFVAPSAKQVQQPSIYDGSSADAERCRAQQSGYATAEVLRLAAVLLESPQWDAADR